MGSLPLGSWASLLHIAPTRPLRPLLAGTCGSC